MEKISDIQVEFLVPPIAKVKLISISEEAAATLAILTRGYSQVYSSLIEENEIADMLEQIKKTKLKTPLEFIQTIWLIKDVTRAFTHQLVRYRIGTQFVQESLRFADKSKARVLVTEQIRADEFAWHEYSRAVQCQIDSYANLIAMGIPVQDARGVLPHHILTDVFFGCSLATLIHIYEQRMCCQAQHHEWVGVVEQMRGQLPEQLQEFLKKPWESGATSCGFGASFDRPCKYQAAFDREMEKRGWHRDGNK